VLILGIAMLVLPGPGILGIIVGVILIIQGRKRSAIGRKSK